MELTNRFVEFDPRSRQLSCLGEWSTSNLQKIQNELKKITWGDSDEIIINGHAVTNMDSAGAWLLCYGLKKLFPQKNKLQWVNFSESQKKLLAVLVKKAELQKEISKRKIPNWVATLGLNATFLWAEVFSYLSFIGQLTYEALRIFPQPKHWRLREVTGVIDASGYQALPIIALLSFMIGVVISYQMGNQLRTYGANVFIVDLLGLSVLREFGPLLTAIMVAGRTGSAFTAQLGIMKINQEIDALNTMGITPSELLLIPRIVGLFIALPLLTIWADIFGIIGGMMMAYNMLGITWYDFLQRFQHEIPLRALLIGLGKAPIFALIIASIGCFEGVKVGGSADSVGKCTTRSVVLAIFFIIVTDAIFSVIFSKFNL